MIGDRRTNRIAYSNRTRSSTPNAPAAAGRGCYRVARLAGRTDALLVIQDDFGGIRQILEVHCFHFGCERLVFDYRVQLAVAKPTRDIQIRRSNARPTSIRDGSFRVEHSAVPLKYAYSCLEERPVTRP